MNDTQRIEISAGLPGQAIVVSGQPVPALYDSLVLECRRRSASANTDIFAEPAIGDQEGLIDWYGDPGEGQFVPWRDLSEDQKAEARESLRLSVESLRRVKDGLDPSFDRLVDAALEVPSENDIIVSEGRPLLVRWGMTADGRTPEVSVVDRILGEETRIATSGVAAPLASPHPMQKGSSVHGHGVSTLLLSTTLTFLALTISGLLMLQNCGLALPKFLTGGRTILIANFCPTTSDAYNPDAELLARLEREIQERDVTCEEPQTQTNIDDDGAATITPEFEEALEAGVVEKVLLRIYDNTSEDGDVVTVTAPGYTRTIALTKEGDTFEIPLVRGEMKLFGEHDGGGGITVSVALTDGTHIVDGSMKEGEQISLTIPQ